MKVFISQPMKGKTNEQINLERESVINAFEGLGYQTIESVIYEEPPKDCNEAIYYLSKSIELLSKADCVYFMKGWERANGCRIEHQIAVSYGKRCIYENEEVY